MTEEEKQDLISRISLEGFSYTFCYYSDFKEIKDKKFHKLRKEYIKASLKLGEYIGYML